MYPNIDAGLVFGNCLEMKTMKNVMLCLVLFFAGILLADEPSPVLNYDFTAAVIRQGGRYEQPLLSPDLRIAAPEHALILTGERGQQELLVPESAGFSIEDGCTFYALVKFEQDGTKASQNDSHDMILFKNKDFLFGRFCDKLYFNAGEKWAWSVMAPGIPVKRWTALAASIRKTSPENYTVQLFIDGSKVAEKSFRGKIAKPNGNPVSIGKGWGGPWFFYGLLGKVLVFEQALDEKLILELARKEPYLKK